MEKGTASLGVDLGGTKLYAGIVDEAGQIKTSERIKTSQNGPMAVLADIVAIANRLASKNEAIKAVGVGMAGQIDLKTGTVLFAPNLKWRDFPLGIELQKALQLPVHITNDVRAAAFGEWKYGAGIGCSDLLCLFFGTGIGSGVVSGGKLLVGSDNAFGEVGHMTIDIQGSLCTCGNRGCFETLAAGWGIAKRASEMLKKGQGGESLLKLCKGDPENISATHVFEAAKSHDPISVLIIKEFKEALICGVANLLNAFNPAKVILGGGIIQGNPELVDIVQRGVTKKALKATSQHVKIVPAMLGGDAGLIGAAAMARDKE